WMKHAMDAMNEHLFWILAVTGNKHVMELGEACNGCKFVLDSSSNRYDKHVMNWMKHAMDAINEHLFWILAVTGMTSM
ncbi:MAG: hypothetical protein ACP5H8_02460, partial [Candidatus Micrarchaeia archaeon]